MSETGQLDPPARDCALCPRLAGFREAQRTTHPDWFNAPVPSFGPDSAELLIVGLAPGLRGANRTGRPFTGDYAGDLLYRSLLKFDWAAGDYAAHPQDGLVLQRARITNAVRCVPPQNRPEPAEVAACGRFLIGEFAAWIAGSRWRREARRHARRIASLESELRATQAQLVGPEGRTPARTAVCGSP